MGKRKLIILYGYLGNRSDPKYQGYINQDYTCMYRSFAEFYGDIIYLTPQKVSRSWEHSITNPKEVIDFCHSRPNDIVWSVKHDPNKDNEIFSKIKNFKYYYSCNNRNSYNKYADVSLVDTETRVKYIPNGSLFLKGKNHKFWMPTGSGPSRIYDYVFMGKRGDKNELDFIIMLNSIPFKRNILWIGGKEFWNKNSCPTTRHEIATTNFLPKKQVRNALWKSKVGILYTEHPMEGFPQSFLEMTMSGVPVIYPTDAPFNHHYYGSTNVKFCKYKSQLVDEAEELLRNVKVNPGIHNYCAAHSASNYSLEKAYQRLVQYAK